MDKFDIGLYLSGIALSNDAVFSIGVMIYCLWKHGLLYVFIDQYENYTKHVFSRRYTNGVGSDTNNEASVSPNPYIWV